VATCVSGGGSARAGHRRVRLSDAGHRRGTGVSDEPSPWPLHRRRRWSPTRSWSTSPCPRAWHQSEQYANNRIESDHGQLKRRLRSIRHLRNDRTAFVIIAGHAVVHNLRRGPLPPHHRTTDHDPHGCCLRRTQPHHLIMRHGQVRPPSPCRPITECNTAFGCGRDTSTRPRTRRDTAARRFVAISEPRPGPPPGSAWRPGGGGRLAKRGWSEPPRWSRRCGRP
jgi:DDE domain